MNRLKYVLAGALALGGLAAEGPQGCGAAIDSPPIQSPLLNPTQSYDDRLRMFHLMKEAHPYPDGWSDHRDGIGLQAQWQMDSERDVADAQGQVFSWWPNVNWTLVVWPFQVLQKYRGEFSKFSVAEFAGWKKSRFQIPPTIVASVLAYYDQLDFVRFLADSGQISSWTKPGYEGTLQKLLWDFHHQAVVFGMMRNTDLLPGLERTVSSGWFPSTDKGERMFAESWGTMVGLLKTIRFPTTLEVVGFFNLQALPAGWVNESDYDLWKSSSLSTSQRITLKALLGIHKFEQKWGHPILKLLTYLISSPEKAKKAVDLVRKATNQGWGGFTLWKSLWNL